jgi:hypothetical protein
VLAAQHRPQMTVAESRVLLDQCTDAIGQHWVDGR